MVRGILDMGWDRLDLAWSRGKICFSMIGSEGVILGTEDFS